MPEIPQDGEFVNLRGVHRLAGAILVQAIEDVRCGSGRRREDAIKWVTDSSEDQFSFVSCCKLLNRDPEGVRRFLIHERIPGWLFSVRLQETETDTAASSC